MDRWARTARAWHVAVAVIGAAAMLLQLGLAVLAGVDPLLPEDAPSMGTTLVRFFSYFTIQANLLVLITSAGLARRPDRDGPVWRVLRADALVGIAVTGLVHWFLLRPLLHLTGLNYLCDKVLHVVVPLLAVLGWLLFGPRPRTSLRTLLWALLWPVVWTAATIIQGLFTRWFPYPFLNVYRLGGQVALWVVAITALFLIMFALLGLGDRRLARRPPP